MIPFIILVLLHALIHLIGFVKAFNPGQVTALTMPVSKPAGVAWLVVTLLFIVFGMLFWTGNKYAWLIGMAAVLTSQVLIITVWKDAKFGTIPNVVILLVAVVSLGGFLLREKFKGHVENDFSMNNNLSTEILTENDITHLPPIVQSYLRYTKSVGQPRIKNFRAAFTGRMRSNPSDDFMQLQSVQYNFYSQPSRYFFMTAGKLGLPATGVHIYQNQTATFEVKMLNWFAVVDAKGDKMNQSETVTLLNDMCCIAPGTLIDDRLKWENINDTTARVTLTNGDISVSAELYFSKNGALQNFISKDRYHTDGKIYENYPWATPLSDYRMLNGYLLPGKAKLIYQRPDGDFTYGELEFKSVRFNLEKMEN